MEDVFCSNRLVYRGIEDNDDDMSFLHTAIQLDSFSIAQSENDILRPPTKKSSRGLVNSLATKTLLGVMICLPTAGNRSGAENNSAHEDRLQSPSALAMPVPIGFLCLSGSSPMSRQSRSSTLGISISRQYQGLGYGSEAINWALDWAFKFGGVHSVSLTCFSFNVRAEELYERLGFVREGRRRERVWFDRAWHDEILFSILESDWETLRKDNVD